MNDEEICQALDRACQSLPLSLYFQVSQQPPYLYIFINRPVESVLDYAKVTALVGETIASLNVENITHLAFYSRPLGLVEHDWEICAPLSDFVQETLVVRFDEEHSEATIRQEIIIPPTNAPSVAGTIEEETTELVDYLADRPFTDLEDLEEETVLRSPRPDQSLQEPEFPRRELALNRADFSQYCFVNDPKDLSQNCQEISPNVAKALAVFHHFPIRGKHRVLPLLGQIFEGDRGIVFIHFPAQVQQWFEHILTLTEVEITAAKFWFSRYCQNSKETLREMQRLLQTPPQDSPPQDTPKPSTQAPLISLDARPSGIPVPAPHASASNESSHTPRSISIAAPAQSTSREHFSPQQNPVKLWIWLVCLGIGSFILGIIITLLYPQGIQFGGWFFLLISLVLQTFSTATSNSALQKLQGGIFTAAWVLQGFVSSDGLLECSVAGLLMGWSVGNLLRLQFLNTQKRLPQDLSGLWELISDRTGTIALSTTLVCFTLPLLLFTHSTS